MSFSIPTLRAYRITTGGITPAAPTFSVGVSCNGSSSVLNGFFSTATAGSSLVYTTNGSDPVYGSNGTTIPCATGYFVTTTPTSCEQQNIGAAICSSGTTTIKAIAYLSGQSSSVATTTACRTCPGSLTAPTSITSSCPLGGGMGCNGGQISFTISGGGGGCAVLRYTIAEGSAPADPTISSNSATEGTAFIYYGTTPATFPPVQVYIKAAWFDPSCSLVSAITSAQNGYVYP
jgi:hypothetical protein